MPFPSALTTQQQNTIETSGYTCQSFVLVDPNDIIFTALINQETFSTVFVSLTFDTVTVGSITDVLDGYTVFIGNETNLKDVPDARIFRVRGNQSAGTTITINETSASLQDNMLIRVVRDTRLNEKLGTINPDTGALLLDYNQTYIAPRPICNDASGFIRANRIQGAGQSVNFALTPVGQVVASGATISSYAWFVNGLQIVSGSTSTQNITLRATAAGWYFPRLTITDSNGVTNWFQYVLVVVNYAYQNTIPANTLRISGELTDGWNAGFNGYDTRTAAVLKAVPDNTQCIIYTEETFDTFRSSTPIVSSVRFWGRFRTETASLNSDAKLGALAESQYVVEGIGLQMGRLPSPEVIMSLSSSPSDNGQMVNLTIWRSVAWLMTSFYTIANVCPVVFGDTTNTYIVPTQESDGSGGVDSLNTILSSINAALAFDPQGGIRIERNARFLGEARNALTTVVNLTSSSWFDYQIVNEQGVTAGRSFAFGASYDTLMNEFVYVKATAPAVAPGRGIGKPQLDGQILPSDITLAQMQSEIAVRGANKLAYENPHPQLGVSLVDGYHGVIMPCDWQWYTFTIPANVNTYGISYTTDDRWLCESVDITFNENGTVDFSAQFAIETDSADAQVSTEISPGQTTPPLNPLPPAPPTTGVIPVPGIGYSDPNPDPNDTPPANQEETDNITDPTQPPPGQETDEPPTTAKGGDYVVCTSPSGCYVTSNFTKTSTPYWRNRTPASSGVGTIGLSPSGGNAVLLTYPGAGSIAWAYDFLWGNGAPTGYTFPVEQFSIVKFEDNASDVMVYSPALLSDITLEDEVFVDSDPEQNVLSNLTTVLDEEYLLEFSGTYRVSSSNSTWRSDAFYWMQGNWNTPLTGANEGILVNGSVPSPEPAFDISHVYTVPFTGTGAKITFRCRGGGGDGGPGLDVKIYSGVSTNAIARRSTNGGTAWGDSQEVGTAVSNSFGFDTQKTGSLMLGVGGNKVRQSTANGAYTDETNGLPTAGTVWAVYFYGKSAVSYIFGQSVLGGDNDSIFKVAGGVKTDITPYDGSNYGIVVVGEPIAVSNRDNNLIFILCEFDGVKKLARSVDGATSWSFITGFDTSAYGVDINPYNDNQVIVSGGDTIWYSSDKGITFYPKQSPGSIYQAWFRR